MKTSSSLLHLEDIALPQSSSGATRCLISCCPKSLPAICIQGAALICRAVRALEDFTEESRRLLLGEGVSTDPPPPKSRLSAPVH